MWRIAVAPAIEGSGNPFDGFSDEEISPITNLCVGMAHYDSSTFPLSNASLWLVVKPTYIDEDTIINRMIELECLAPIGLLELTYLAHACGSEKILNKIADLVTIYRSRQALDATDGSSFPLAFLALFGVAYRIRNSRKEYATLGLDRALIQTMKTIDIEERAIATEPAVYEAIRTVMHWRIENSHPISELTSRIMRSLPTSVSISQPWHAYKQTFRDFMELLECAIAANDYERRDDSARHVSY